MLPKPHPLGMDISAISSPDMLAEYTDKDSYYPDAVALTYDESTSKITTVYSDRSFYMWDIKDMKKIGKYRSFIAHTDCVWGVEVIKINHVYINLFLHLFIITLFNFFSCYIYNIAFSS